MPISRKSLDKVPLSFASVSVGTTSTPLRQKLSAISLAGFKGIELGFPDLVSFASSFHKKEIREDDYEHLCSAGEEVKKICKEKRLEIMMLQPFANFEGWPEGSKERDEAFSRAKGWIRVMGAVGTDMLQVGSTDTPSSNIITSPEVIAHDLRILADLLSPHSYRLAYENWCWSTHAPTWQSVYHIIQLANRPNIGLCLDTFQTVGSEYADPCTASGLIEDKGFQERLELSFADSLRNLTNTIPKEKIYLLQLSDAYRPLAPLKPGMSEGEAATDTGMSPRGRWSHDFRPYFHNGGFYSNQCIEMCKAVLATGTRCWFSVEVFDGGPSGEGGNGTGMSEDEVEMEYFCRGAMGSCERMWDECGDVP